MQEQSLNQTVTTLDPYRAAQDIAELLIHTPGVLGVRFAGLGITAGSMNTRTSHSVTATIKSDDAQWGEVWVWFDGRILESAAAAGLARIAGEQVGEILAEAYSNSRWQSQPAVA